MLTATLLLIMGALLSFVTLNPLFFLLCIGAWLFSRRQEAIIKAADPNDSADSGGCGLAFILAVLATIVVLGMVATMGEQRTADIIRTNVNAPLSTLEAQTNADLREQAQRVYGVKP